MNRTEWYLTGGLIAAGVVILILLYWLFRRPRSVGSGVLNDLSKLTHSINPETGKPWTEKEENKLLNEVKRQIYLDNSGSSDESYNTASSGDDEDTPGSGDYN